MPVTSITKDPLSLTMTVVADFPVPVQRLWDAYADPRQLEQFWGPPTYPSRFTRHDMHPGGRSDYVMTGPAGDVHAGYWEFLQVRPGESFEVLDGFANADGTTNDDLPTNRSVFVFSSTANGSRVTVTSHFGSLSDLEQLVQMGMEEGMRAAMGQIDEVLADLRSFATGKACEADILSDTQARVARVIRGPVEQVWRAHQEPELVQRWLLGPEGWTMPVCEVAREVGDTYRYEWESADGSQRFGFTGELLELTPPWRSVATESMIGVDGPATINELTLTRVEGGTLVSIVISYPTPELRDMILATGMTNGMEASYRRLESEVLAPS
jgi:uncharacterized protein YndB with AHSA1/START domain